MTETLPYLSKEAIQNAVAETAHRISTDYAGRRIVLIGVLKGAYVFLSDLTRSLSIPTEVDFVRVASYGAGTQSSGDIRLTKDIEIDIRQKDVLIIEDIVDSGLTTDYLKTAFRRRKPASLGVCALIDKRERRETDIRIDYSCFVVKAGFLVGYGMDFAEDYRYLPDIRIVNSSP
jgi:hypoxanthine phosphoribosyltransferase